MEQRIRTVLKREIDPILQRHHGRAVLVKVEEGVATVRLEGACAGCPDAEATFETVVRAVLRREIPAIRDVVMDESGEEEMLQLARAILRASTEDGRTGGTCAAPEKKEET